MSATPTIPAERICVVRLGAFGDTIHALAMVNGLRQLYPEAHLSWVLEPVPAEIVREQEIDELIVFEPGRGLRGWIELYLELRAKNEFDLLLLPQVSFRAGVVAALADARVKLGYDWKRSREGHWIFANRHLPPGEVRHAQDLFLEFLDYLGLKDYEPEWNLTFTAEEREEQRRFFDGVPGPVLGLVVASSDPEKDWPAENYAAVAREARSELGLVPMLIGGPSAREQDQAGRIAALLSDGPQPIIALDGPVRTMLWKLEGSEVVVAPDTGPLHAAVAMGVPTIGLYGFSNPRRCGPYRGAKELLIDVWTDAGEEREISRRTKRGRMARISPEDVLERLAKVVREGVAGDRRRGAD